MLRIITNHNWRQFTYRYDVPDEVLKDQFDWLDEETIDGFFCYKGYWYHTSQFTCIVGGDEPINLWHGVHNDSFFSGVLVRLSDDAETYQVGTFLS